MIGVGGRLSKTKISPRLLTEVSADASFNSMNGALSIAAVTDLAISHFLERRCPLHEATNRRLTRSIQK